MKASAAVVERKTKHAAAAAHKPSAPRSRAARPAPAKKKPAAAARPAHKASPPKAAAKSAARSAAKPPAPKAAAKRKPAAKPAPKARAAAPAAKKAPKVARPAPKPKAPQKATHTAQVAHASHAPHAASARPAEKAHTAHVTHAAPKHEAVAAPAPPPKPIETAAPAHAVVHKAPEPPKPAVPAPSLAPAVDAPRPLAHVPVTTAGAVPALGPSPEGARPPQPPRPGMPRPGQVMIQAGRPIAPSRAAAKEESFAEGDYVVYPTHGVGKVEKIATEDIAGHRLELIHITFEENRMTLRVPVTKARSAGLRKLATRKMFEEAMGVLKGRARIKRTMWSRRAQEYEAKINSGDPIAIAEVVRDLHRNAGQPDQSFSERQIYEAAMDRLAAELAALDQTDKLAASVKLTNFLKTG